jgi:hypothetical protein
MLKYYSYQTIAGLIIAINPNRYNGKNNDSTKKITLSHRRKAF